MLASADLLDSGLDAHVGEQVASASLRLVHIEGSIHDRNICKDKVSLRVIWQYSIKNYSNSELLGDKSEPMKSLLIRCDGLSVP